MAKLTKGQRKLLPGRKLRNIAIGLFVFDFVLWFIWGIQEINVLNFWQTGFGSWGALHFIALGASLILWTFIVALWAKGKKLDKESNLVATSDTNCATDDATEAAVVASIIAATSVAVSP